MRFRRVAGRPVGAGTLGLVAAGGVLIGAGAAAMIAAGLGVAPWDVLTTAVAGRAGVSVGVAGAALSVAVYLLCAPFGRLPGWGNAVLLVTVSGAVDAGLAVLGEPGPTAAGPPASAPAREATPSDTGAAAAPASTGSTAATSSTAYNPQWDAARGTYIVWEPQRGQWLGWDEASKQGGPL